MSDSSSVENKAAKAENVFAALLQSSAALSSESPANRFSKLRQLINSESNIPDKVLCDCVFNTLVAGQFDLDTNFLISSVDTVRQLIAFLADGAPVKLLCEIWQTLRTVLERSRRNVLRCIEGELIECLLDELQKPTTTQTLADLIVELLCILTTHSITAKQLRLIIAALRVRNQVWPRYSLSLLQVLRAVPDQSGPRDFFSFSGNRGCAICLPPLSNWPPDRWTFTTRFYLDPVQGAMSESQRPFLYTFGNARGVACSANFVGPSLQLTCTRAKGRTVSLTVQHDFATRTWYHLAVSYVHNRWTKDVVCAYVNGQPVLQAELNWHATSSEPFDRCLLGSSFEQEPESMFSGCLGAVYVFCEALSAQQVSALFQAGPNYQNQLRFENELAITGCTEVDRRALFSDTKLSGSLLILYNPAACDGQLCLNQAPKVVAAQYFAHSPHAMMQPQVSAVHTSSLCAALHSLGGIQVLYPLFSQLDAELLHNHSDAEASTDAGSSKNGDGLNIGDLQNEYNHRSFQEVATLLISLLVSLMKQSNVVEQQLLTSRGFLIIACHLERASALHLTASFLDATLDAARYLLAPNHDPSLQRQMFDYLLFNPSLWIRAHPAVQVRLYEFLSSEQLITSPLFSQNAVQRTATVLQAVHAIKHYYWVVNSHDRDSNGPSKFTSLVDRSELTSVRLHLLALIGQLISRTGDDVTEHLQALLNYLTIVNEDENLLDVLQFSVRLMAENPALLVPAFDRLAGVRTVFKLLASADKRVRVLALKLLGFFLYRCTPKRKADTMGEQNLLALLVDRLLSHDDRISFSVYNALMELLCDRPTFSVQNDTRIELDASMRIQNPTLLKPIATAVLTTSDHQLRRAFVLDLHLLCTGNIENRHMVLQQPVWQHWLLQLAFLWPRDDFERQVTESVMLTFRSLLYHAVRHEVGGWRVWMDTVSILHSLISADEFRRRIEQLYNIQSSVSQRAHGELEDHVSLSQSQTEAKSKGTSVHAAESEQQTSFVTSTAYESGVASSGPSSAQQLEVSPQDTQTVDTSLSTSKISALLPSEIPPVTETTPVIQEPILEGSSAPILQTVAVSEATETKSVLEAPVASEEESIPHALAVSEEPAASEAEPVHETPVASEAEPMTEVSTTLESEQAPVTSKAEPAASETEAATIEVSTTAETELVPESVQEAPAASEAGPVHETPVASETEAEPTTETSPAPETEPVPESAQEAPAASEAEPMHETPAASETEAEPTTETSTAPETQLVPEAPVTSEAEPVHETPTASQAEASMPVSTTPETEPVPESAQEVPVTSEAEPVHEIPEASQAEVSTEVSTTPETEPVPEAPVTSKAEPVHETPATSETEAEPTTEASTAPEAESVPQPLHEISAASEAEPTKEASTAPETELALEASVRSEAEPVHEAPVASETGPTTNLEAEPISEIAATYAIVSAPEMTQVVQSSLESVSALEIGEAQTPATQVSVVPKSALTSEPHPGHVERTSIAIPAFRIPEFRWNALHLRLLDDLLAFIEQDIYIWKCDRSKTLFEQINLPENVVYNQNMLHIISQLSDGFVCSCGGLLPLLAAATSSNAKVDVLELGHGVSIEVAMFHLARLANLADVFIFGSKLSLAEIEQNNALRGIVLRRCARMIFMSVTRNVIETRFRLFGGYRITQAANYSDRNFAESEEKTQAERSGGAIDALLNGFYRIVSAKHPDSHETTGTSTLTGVGQSITASIAQDTLRDLQTLLQPLRDIDKVLQDIDVARLRALLYRDLEASKQANFLSLATVYVISVLIVSRYRDILEPPNLVELPATGELNGQHLLTKSGDNDSFKRLEPSNVTENQPSTGISRNDGTKASVPPHTSTSITDDTQEGARTAEWSTDVTAPTDGVAAKLERATGNCVPLLLQILNDFSSFLSGTLLGSHGQELVQAGLRKLNTSAEPQTAGGVRGPLAPGSSTLVETVMLLCSQEWQNALQKTAGMAFIEIVNEGRLLAQSTRDYLVRVAVEVDFVLNRARADDVQKHSAFDTICAQSILARIDEERLCDGLIAAARARDLLLARKIKDKMLALISTTRSPWHKARKSREFWRLDSWEDDSRRRRRFVRNQLGSTHSEASHVDALVDGNQPSSDVTSRPLVRPSQPQETNNYVTDEELFNVGSESEKQLVDESSELLTTSPVVFAARCQLIAPGVAIVGQLSITKTELCFAMDDVAPENSKLDPTVLSYVEHTHGRWLISDIRAIFSRRYMLQNVALEMFLVNRSAIMFAFADQATVRSLVYILPPVGVGSNCGIRPSRKASLATPRQLFKLSDVPAKWQRRELSNFDYLMFINTISGRTFNDLNQYPIFPWVLVNYDSAQLDLSNSSNYRDLSKPIGALNPARRIFFEERYQFWNDPTVPAYHYRTHYSTEAYVVDFLVRLEPFASIHLALHGGRFDHPSRIFSNVAQTWRNCQREVDDVRELVPEFYYLPELFENRNGFQFGAAEKTLFSDVQLPTWAQSPEHFVRINRLALESEFVSCQLHSWIDLVFGYKQRGPEAVRATNVFYFMTYEGAVNANSLTDSELRAAVEKQIRNSGQTPAVLLTEPHLPRSSYMHGGPLMLSRAALQDPVCYKMVSNSPLVALAANSNASLAQPVIVTVAANRSFTVNRWLAANNQPQSFMRLTNTTAPASSLLEIDPLIQQTVSTGSAPSRRLLGEGFDQRLTSTASHFVVTADSRAILACGFWDRSLRVFSTADARVLQVVYGHFDVLTCVVRSECNANLDCYVVTGSRDCTLMLWLWSATQQAIVNETDQFGNPRPRCTFYGHDSEIVCASVSGELGLVVSGSRDGTCLIHTLVGEVLHSLALDALDSGVSNSTVNPSEVEDVANFKPKKVTGLVPEIVLTHREGIVLIKLGASRLAVFTINGKLLKQFDHPDQINALALTRDGQHLVVGTERGTVQIWLLHDFSLLFSFVQSDLAVRSLAITHDQQFIVAGGSAGIMMLYNVDFSRWQEEFSGFPRQLQ